MLEIENPSRMFQITVFCYKNFTLISSSVTVETLGLNNRQIFLFRCHVKRTFMILIFTNIELQFRHTTLPFRFRRFLENAKSTFVKRSQKWTYQSQKPFQFAALPLIQTKIYYKNGSAFRSAHKSRICNNKTEMHGTQPRILSLRFSPVHGIGGDRLY